ncbi:MAG TPA: DNA translocase FtsK, partial [Candidatus Cybelea sp.]
MARTRRRASARTRLNLEIVGIAAVAFAVFCGVALAFPHHSGAIGNWTAAELRRLFGGAAPFFPVLVALLGTIVFLEVNVLRTMAWFGSTTLAYFLILNAMLGAGGQRRGGTVGATIWWTLHALVGNGGAWIVLWLTLISLTLWLTNASAKRLIGRAIVFFGGLRPAIPKLPRLEVELPRGHDSLHEAFALPIQPIVPLNEAVRQRVIPTEAPAAGVIETPIFDPPAAVVEEPPRPAPPLDPARGDAGIAYRLPDLSLFDVPPSQKVDESNRAHILEDTLASFGVGAKVSHIERGPSITRYELKPERGVKISRIASLADDLALALAATSVRIEAPIPGKSAVGIEIPNLTVSVVAIREILDAVPNRGQVPPLWMALGKDITGRPVIGDLCNMPHLLVAGATGAGKSVCLNMIIASLLVTATPDQVQMLMIDPKRVELTVFNGIPHLIKEVIADPRLAAGALFEMTKEMESRYERFAKASVRKIEEYNAKYPDERLPYVVVIIDELADLM